MTSPPVRRLGLVTWADPRPSGGNVYNDALVAALRAAGTRVSVQRVPGRWPDPDEVDQERLAAALQQADDLLVDGIVASGAPGVVARAVSAGHRVVVLCHMSIADEIGLAPPDRARRAEAEAGALGSSSGVITPSRWAADLLRARYRRLDVGIARPGVAPAPVAPGSGDGHALRLLVLAAVTPTKDQLTLVRALARVGDLPWQAHLIGSTEVDPDYVAAVRAEIVAAGLTTRVHLRGALLGTALDTEWSATDLVVLPSRTETYGLVVIEALARGIPSVVTAGTGAVEALGAGAAGAVGAAGSSPGTAVPGGDPAALADVLRGWLTDPELRRTWRAAAIARRDTLPGWRSTASAVLAHLDRIGSTPTGSTPGPGPMPPPAEPPSTG